MIDRTHSFLTTITDRRFDTGVIDLCGSMDRHTGSQPDRKRLTPCSPRIPFTATSTAAVSAKIFEMCGLGACRCCYGK